MQDDLEPVSFQGLTREEQIGKCHAMAAEAEGFAAVNQENSDGYLKLAAKWYELAEDMQGAQRLPTAAKGKP